MEFFEFMFRSFWHFVGIIFFLSVAGAIAGTVTEDIIYAFKNKQ